MAFHEYESMLDRPTNLKISDFSYNERLLHVILSAQFDQKMLNKLIRTADRIRALAKSKEGSRFLNGLLSHKRALLYFTQPSTRTFNC